MSDDTTLAAVLERRVIPVVVLEDAGAARALADALVAGGLPVAEVTFRTEHAAKAIETLARDTGMLVGAGTVVRPELVDRAVDAGARFVVAPGFSRAVVERCFDLGVPVVPGVATASEVMAALEYGLDVVKFFPAEAAGGVAALGALAAPFPGVRFVPTGGITADNAPAYLRHPSVAAVGASWMAAPELLRARDFAEVTRRTSEVVALAGGPP
jgi:2-dehydro-3-deoxyphosphogluconate aldolase/(4S)-4-hydroxy-2-oxoglutarate aldolase